MRSSAKTRIEMGEEKYPNWQHGRPLQLQRAWVVNSAWASIENVCKISSSLLVNKFQCEHIAEHFKVTGDVLKKLGLDKDFVSGQALEGGTGIQTKLTSDEMHFSRIAETFEEHVYNHVTDPEIFNLQNGDLCRRSRLQGVSSMFEDYIREQRALDVFREESLSKVNEEFQGFSLRNIEARCRDRKQSRLDAFLCCLLGILKQGEDLVLFHSGLEGANNGVVERTGLYGEKFVEIHELLYELLDYYACLEHCEGTQFARGYLSGLDSCGTQSLLCYLNSDCLVESLSIDDKFLNMELATTVSELLERPNCALKTLFIKSSSRVKVDQEELRKCRLMVIAAFSKCVSITSLTVRGSNGEEVHELCKSLSAHKGLNHLVISIDRSLGENDAMDLSAMLKENHSLTSFTLESDGICFEGIVYLEAMLIENSVQEMHLRLKVLNAVGLKHLIRFLMANKDGGLPVILSLKGCDSFSKTLGSTSRGVVNVAPMLYMNKTRAHFSMEFLNLVPNAACEVLDSLKNNKSLQVLDLQGYSSFGNNSKVAACLEAMLAENSTLEELKVDLHKWDKFCFKSLLRPLMANKDGEGVVNISLRRLHILNYYHQGDVEFARTIAQMLCTNTRLNHFSMINASLSGFDVHEIVESLKINKALQVLNLDECKGLEDTWVKVTLMDLFINYNFTLSTIRMHGRDLNIEAFMKSELADPRGLWFTSRSPTVFKENDLKQALEDFQLEKGEGSTREVCESSAKASEKHQKELVVGQPSKPKIVIFGLKSKLERESEQSLEKLKQSPLLESVMQSRDFLLQRNLNMAQLLQERYAQWSSFAEMYPSKLTNEEKDELNKGCITAALFPTTFLYHLKVHLLQGLNSKGILHTLKEVANLVVQRMKSLQDSGSQTFQFIDCIVVRAPLDIQHMYSSRETIAICQTFKMKTSDGREVQVGHARQYGIAQDHLTGAYYFDCDEASNLDKPDLGKLNLDKPIGVIGVKVKSTEIHVEMMWEDGSYYSGALEDFSYDLELDDNKQCALEAFGYLKGACFLNKTCGLKCSPLLVIALAMAIDKKGFALTWSNGKGHIQNNCSLQLEDSEVWECQILYGGHINELGEAAEWGMNQFAQNYASSKRDNQHQVVVEQNPNQNIPNGSTLICDKCNDTSHHTQSHQTLANRVAELNAGAQYKQKFSIGIKVLGSGGEIGFEKQNSKGKKIVDRACNEIEELYWKEKGGYVIRELNARHEFLEERLYQGALYAEPDFNYLVVYDGCTASHVSIYFIDEQNDGPRLELEWITDIFIKKGLERIKEIFKELKGATLDVTRTGTQFLEGSLEQQPKGLMKYFLNCLPNKGSCEGSALKMDHIPLDHHKASSNDEWKHIVGLQLDKCSNKFWWVASYMQAMTYSRTRYSSGLLLSTHTTEKHGKRCGSCTRKSRRDGKDYVHQSPVVTSFAKLSQPPKSLSSKWHDIIHWGG